MKLVSVETPEKSVCKMTFSASAEELEAASNAVYERTRATYTIKGFAKGEADRAQIEADRGEHTFWYDAINDLMDKDVPALYDAAMAEHGFHAVDEPVYDLVSVKKDEGFVATATTALQPELSLTQTTGFKTECVTPEVTDKEIDAVLERRRAMAAELVPHKGPAVKGNIVHIDYEGLLEGKPFNGGTAQNQTLLLSPLTVEFAALGEASGHLPALLSEAARLLDQDFQARLKQLRTLLEPVLLLVLALGCAGMLAGLLSPLFALLQGLPLLP